MTPSVGHAMFLAACGCIVTMKLISLAVAPRLAPAGWFLASPLLATASWAAVEPATRSAVRACLRHLVMCSVGLAVAVAAARWAVGACAPSTWVAGYITVPVALLCGEVIGTTLQVVWASSGWLVPAHHADPLLARTIGEFWSRRWNRWVGDWLAQVCYRPLRQRRALAVLATFLASGLLHESFLTLPLLVTTGHDVAGLPTLYFVIQTGAVLLDARLRAGPASVRRLLLWVAVVAPAPLILDETFLRAFGFM